LFQSCYHSPFPLCKSNYTNAEQAHPKGVTPRSGVTLHHSRNPLKSSDMLPIQDRGNTYRLKAIVVDVLMAIFAVNPSFAMMLGGAIRRAWRAFPEA
jgi:hypothetical protein